MARRSLAALQKRLRYTFADPGFLKEALRHSSYVNEQLKARLSSNERLEFLGDAVVNLVVGHILMEKFPDLPEGDLSRTRAQLVNESRLASLAEAVGIGDFILLGKGERQTNGRRKPSILADAYEAVAAAVYLDGGFAAAFDFIRRHFDGVLADAPDLTARGDHKSRLQEIIQTSHKTPPEYSVAEESGPDHDKTFRVVVNAGKWSAEGEGKSKKAAEQQAARKVIERIQRDRPKTS